jgi:hypothetical protein
MSVPQASPISLPSSSSSVGSSSVATLEVESIIPSLKHLSAADLFKIIKTATSEAEKKCKESLKNTKKTKKAGSAPKGVIPNQLKKNLAWVKYTLNHATKNGWEEFLIVQNKKDKLTGENTTEEFVMPYAIKNSQGVWVYEGSITEAAPSGRQIIQKEAMTLSKIRKNTSHYTYADFEATYDDTSDNEPVISNKATAKATKDAEKASAKAVKDAEKAAAKAAKEAEKAAAKAAKEAEKKTPVKSTLSKKPIVSNKHVCSDDKREGDCGI